MFYLQVTYRETTKSANSLYKKKLNVIFKKIK